MAGLSSLRGVRFVADETGLKDRYDFELMASWETGGNPAEGVQPRGVNPDAASVFTALPEQLGLKLEPCRTAIRFFTIDRLDAPTEIYRGFRRAEARPLRCSSS